MSYNSKAEFTDLREENEPGIWISHPGEVFVSSIRRYKRKSRFGEKKLNFIRVF